MEAPKAAVPASATPAHPTEDSAAQALGIIPEQQGAVDFSQPSHFDPGYQNGAGSFEAGSTHAISAAPAEHESQGTGIKEDG